MAAKQEKNMSAGVRALVEALKILPRRTRRQILLDMADDASLREDLEAALLWESRKNEPRRPFREYLAD